MTAEEEQVILLTLPFATREQGNPVFQCKIEFKRRGLTWTEEHENFVNERIKEKEPAKIRRISPTDFIRG